MISKVQKVLDKDDLWIFFTDEGSDRYFKKYISSSVVGMSAAFIGNKKYKILVGGLDEKNVLLEKEIFNSTQEFESLFLKILGEFDYPKNVYLNFGKGLIHLPGTRHSARLS